MSTPDERPMSGTAFVLMTVLIILGAIFLLRWVFSTLTFVFNSLLLMAVLAGAVYLYVKSRGSRG